MKKILLSCTFLFFLIFFASFVSANYELIVFEDYSTSYYVKGRTLLVEKELILKNTGNVAAIPGEIHFRVSEQHGDSSRGPLIKDVVALHNANKLDSRVDRYDTFSDVVVHIWSPLLPDFEYRFTLSYEMDFRPKGVFFHEVVFPVEETTIPIRERDTRMMLPTGFAVTFAPNANVRSDGLYKIVDWGSRTDLSLEYTRLPMPQQMPFRMVSVFWLVVLVFLGTLFIFLNLKRSSSKNK